MAPPYDKESEKMSKKRLQLLGQQKTMNTSPSDTPTSPAPSALSYHNKALASYHSTPNQPLPTPPPVTSAPTFSGTLTSSHFENHPRAFESFYWPASLSFGFDQLAKSSFTGNTVPGLPGSYGVSAYEATAGSSTFGPGNPPILEDESEKVARDLQAMFDAEGAPEANLSVWPTTSPFNSDEEYAYSLADGYDQLSGKPIPPSKSSSASPSGTYFVEADAKSAREMQAELDSGGIHRTGADRQTKHGLKEQHTVEIDLETDAVPLHAFGQRVLKTECANCKKHLLYSEKDVIQLTKKWFDKQASRRATSYSIKRKVGVLPSNGIGYGGGHEIYGAYYYDDDETGGSGPVPSFLARRGRAAVKPVVMSKDNIEDLLLTQVYSVLTKLLPSLLDTGHPFDLNPPEVLAVMLKRSPVLEKAVDLLRSDSLDDMTRRHKLYQVLLGFVERLANHSATAPTVFAPGVVYPADAGLLSASFNDHRYELRSSDKGRFKAETCRALSEVALQMEIPARKMLQRSKAAEADFGTPDGKNMLDLCRETCKLADFLRANQQPHTDEPSYRGKGKEPVRPQENLSKWHQEHCVDEVPDETFSKNFHFWTESSSARGLPSKGRMKSLMTELATLQTSLPRGIYVRHGSSRLDMMKIIIVGPDGSPYEGGLFEFDLWCPFDYPNTPPRMQFKTTGGGQAHFNPNLYTDGKVCLSLLGTWSGQPWVAAGPNKSTLLQLFISIQAMILCSEPWYNEPGREARPNPAASANYNRLVQTLTIPHALTSWLRQGKINDPVWTDVIEKHFRFNGQAILKSVRRWAREATALMKKLPAPSHSKPHVDTGGQLSPLSTEAHLEILGGTHFSLGRVAVKIPGLAKDFEQALQSAFGIIDMEDVSPTGGEGKRKFGEA
ncbi:hypothetical protein FKW77_010147 [Venturia effusa]|uniref:UBC core domain-containing protein n=1 Tax=Venturia effusa TaxID=50376 RepID=A0A517L2A2_9PEZI|nr:hypothetical protein FKW77_010147 [Venturia effusa]